MMHAVDCKFCHRPITVEIDDDFQRLRASAATKLLALACCNRCGDLRVRRWGLSGRIQRSANAILAMGNAKGEVLDRARKGLTVHCQRYAELIAEWHGKEGSCWDESIVDMIMKEPQRWGEALGLMWKLYKQWERDQQAEATML